MYVKLLRVLSTKGNITVSGPLTLVCSPKAYWNHRGLKRSSHPRHQYSGDKHRATLPPHCTLLARAQEQFWFARQWGLSLSKQLRSQIDECFVRSSTSLMSIVCLGNLGSMWRSGTGLGERCRDPPWKGAPTWGGWAGSTHIPALSASAACLPLGGLAWEGGMVGLGQEVAEVCDPQLRA